MSRPITENAFFTQNPDQVTVQTSPSGLILSRLMALPIVRHKPFHGIPVPVIRLRQLPRRMVAQAFGTGYWSGGGAISHSVAPTPNKTYIATFRTQYYLTMHGVWWYDSASGWRGSEQLFRLRPCRPAATASPIGLAAEQALFPGRTIQPQSQWVPNHGDSYLYS